MGSTTTGLQAFRDQVKSRFAELLKERRTEAGISGAELARRAGLDRGNYYRLEGGSVNPSLSMIVRLSKALEMSVKEFLDGFEVEFDFGEL